jgi:hypothetical protein
MQISEINSSILNILLTSIDKMPKNSLPINTQGTVQQNFSSTPTPTIYNAHGIVTPNSPNTLIAKV